MAGFTIKRDHRTVEFSIATDEKIVSHRGTEFVPNHCDAIIEHGKIITLNLSKLDEHGYGIDDPAGPDGAELNASLDPLRTNLPEIALEALNIIRWHIR